MAYRSLVDFPATLQNIERDDGMICLLFGGFHSHGGTPKLVVFANGTIPSFEMDDDLGSPYDSGNLHLFPENFWECSIKNPSSSNFRGTTKCETKPLGLSMPSCHDSTSGCGINIRINHLNPGKHMEVSSSWGYPPVIIWLVVQPPL